MGEFGGISLFIWLRYSEVMSNSNITFTRGIIMWMCEASLGSNNMIRRATRRVDRAPVSQLGPRGRPRRRTYFGLAIVSSGHWPLVWRPERCGLCPTPSWKAPSTELAGLRPASSNAGKRGSWFGLSSAQSLQPEMNGWGFHPLTFGVELVPFAFWTSFSVLTCSKVNSNPRWTQGTLNIPCTD